VAVSFIVVVLKTERFGIPVLVKVSLMILSKIPGRYSTIFTRFTVAAGVTRFTITTIASNEIHTACTVLAWIR